MSEVRYNWSIRKTRPRLPRASDRISCELGLGPDPALTYLIYAPWWFFELFWTPILESSWAHWIIAWNQIAWANSLLSSVTLGKHHDVSESLSSSVWVGSWYTTKSRSMLGRLNEIMQAEPSTVPWTWICAWWMQAIITKNSGSRGREEIWALNVFILRSKPYHLLAIGFGQVIKPQNLSFLFHKIE